MLRVARAILTTLFMASIIIAGFPNRGATEGTQSRDAEWAGKIPDGVAESSPGIHDHHTDGEEDHHRHHDEPDGCHHHCPTCCSMGHSGPTLIAYERVLREALFGRFSRSSDRLLDLSPIPESLFHPPRPTI